MTKFHRICVFLLSSVAFSCSNNNLHTVLKLSGSNRDELEKVLEHYPRGSQKRQAAEFLVENMLYQGHFAGRALDNYRALMAKKELKLDPNYPEVLDTLWSSVNTTEETPSIERDMLNIRADYLIADIESAFNAWESAPWKDSITFEIFLNYILPYKVQQEPLYPFRKYLREKYLPLVEGVSSPRKAYEIIHQNLTRAFSVARTTIKYNYYDPIIMSKTMSGTCNERTVYIVNVMRSLGIPVAFDFTPRFANYSSNAAHSWAAYISKENESYGMADGDSVSHRNPLPLTTKWKYRYRLDENQTLFKIDSMKKVFKVWRNTFKIHPLKDIDYDDNLMSGLVQPNVSDVSELYDITGDIEVKASKRKKENVYICTFETGKGWLPFDVVAQKGRKVRFENVNVGICYLMAYKNGDDFIPVANPVTIHQEGVQHILNPGAGTETVLLRRKYILVCSFLQEWAYGLGSTFEASNNLKFIGADTLFKQTTVPIGPQNYRMQPNKPYRYVRFNAKHRRVRVAELAFYGTTPDGKEVELTGTMISDSIDQENALKAFDKDYATDTQKDRLHINPAPFWIGLDLGADNHTQISRIHFSTYSDANFVEPHHEYELFYYDMGWHSLGKKEAEREYLIYDNVPKNALLWLRDLTKGTEERIFTYEHDKQVWW